MKKIYTLLICCFLFSNSYCQKSDTKEIKATKLYKGEKKAADEVAVLCKGVDYCPDAMNSIKFGGHVKTYIMDKGKLKTIRNKGCVAILPDTADICFQVNMMAGYVMNGTTLTYKNLCMSFQAEAGHNYTLDACTGMNPGAWIVDRTTNRIVDAKGNIPNEFFTANPLVLK